MKTILITLLLLVGFLCRISQAQITVTSPNGGESLPRNGYMIFWWENAVPLQVFGFLDRYDNNGALIQSYEMIGKGYFHTGIDSASNSGNDINTATMPTGLYKLRVIGWTQDGHAFTDESDNFFAIARDASMACFAVNSNDWMYGQTKAFTLSWNGFNVGDPYAVYFRLADDYIGEGYGFILKSGYIESENGSMTFDAPFPNESMSAYPEGPSVPVDATYVATFFNNNCNLSAKTDRVSLILKEVRIQPFEQKEFQSVLLKEMVPLTLVVDARYAHEDVRTLTMPIIVASEDEHAEFLCALYDRNHQVSDARVIKMTEEGHYGYAEFTARNVNIRKGSTSSLELRCTPIHGIGMCQFGLSRDGKLTVRGSRRSELSSAMRAGFNGYWGPGVTITKPVLRPRPGHRPR